MIRRGLHNTRWWWPFGYRPRWLDRWLTLQEWKEEPDGEEAL